METKHQWLERALAELTDDLSRSWDSYPCLLWPFAQKGKHFENGEAYGAVYYEGKLQSVSREAWRIVHGSIPKGKHILHHCDVRRCFRPVHLFVGTTLDNLRDCSKKGRMHPGEKNPGAKLTDRQVAQIRKRIAEGDVQRAIARDFGMSATAIWKIAHGLKWKQFRPAPPHSP